MGDEIETSHFTEDDFRAFEERLKVETNLLAEWFKEGRFANGPPTAGAELEAWLVDPQFNPAAKNNEFLRKLNREDVVPELASFNVEFNTDPLPLSGSMLSQAESNLRKNFRVAEQTAEDMGLHLLAIGILPTVKDEDLIDDNMSGGERYRAINDQIFELRKGKPIHLSITNKEHLSLNHRDVMLEAAATSFQIHLKVDQDHGVDFYNASKIASAPMVAISANSPYLFQHDLWAETRIPLFEQAVSVGEWDYSERVTFGVSYLDASLYEVFQANRQRYQALLPQCFDDPPEKLSHLRLHNGTIWRWNRALIGFDDDDTPHLRIEHRVVPAGPTAVDLTANMAFYFGVVYGFMQGEAHPGERVPFWAARDNFYDAARDGYDARVIWEGRRSGKMSDLILDELLPMAREGLEALGLDHGDIEHYLGIIQKRTQSGQNGATWQRAYVDKHGRDWNKLTEAYFHRQMSGEPVHEWAV